MGRVICSGCGEVILYFDDESGIDCQKCGIIYNTEEHKKKIIFVIKRAIIVDF